MPKNPYAGLLLQDDDNECVLICQTSSSPAKPVKSTGKEIPWVIPKKLCVDSETPFETALKGFTDATGYDLVVDHIANSSRQSFLTIKQQTEILTVFRVRIAGASGTYSPTNDYIFLWVKPEEALGLVHPGLRDLFSPKSPLHSSKPSSNIRTIRLLCFHGWDQTLAIFEKRTKTLKKKFEKAGIELVYVEAPHEVPTTIEGETFTRGWWYYNPENRADNRVVVSPASGDPFQAHGVTCYGLDESIDLIARIWKEQGPFDGIFAFSQGASMASIIAKLSMSDERFTGMKLVVLVSGFYLQPGGCSWYTGPIEVPSLHVMGREDTFVPMKVNRQLLALYPNAEVFEHNGGHATPQTANDINLYINFIEKFR